MTKKPSLVRPELIYYPNKSLNKTLWVSIKFYQFYHDLKLKPSDQKAKSSKTWNDILSLQKFEQEPMIVNKILLILSKVETKTKWLKSQV